MASDLGGARDRDRPRGLGESRASRRREKRRRTVVVATVAGGTIALMAIVAVAFAVTRSDDSGPVDVGTPKATTTSSPTTTTTTIPVSTTVVPKSPDPIVALAQQYDGRYVGTFQNATYNTTGPATLGIRVDPVAGMLEVEADFDGDLFGGDAKEVRRISGTVKLGDPNAALTTQTKAFGPVTGRVDQTLALVLTADDVPGAKVKGFALTGRLREDLTGFDATYTVAFEDGATAEGTMAVTCDPAGSRTNEVTTICALTQETGAPTP